MDKIAIFKRLKQHYNKVKDSGYNIAFLALQGSQNYNLEDEFSDVDSIAIIIPSLNDIALNNKPVSKTLNIDNEKIDIKDIRLFKDNLIKQNTQYLQVLFTKYKIVNSIFKDYIEALYNIKEEITCIDRLSLYKNIIGIGRHCFVNAKEDNNYNGKALSHLMRLYNLCKNLLNNMSYDNALITYSDKDMIMKAKRNQLNLSQANNIADLTFTKLSNLAFDIVDKKYEYKYNIVDKVNNIIKNLISYSLQLDMKIEVKEINLEQYPNVYFISDTHFGHENIIKYEHRDEKMNIKTVQEQDEKLINNWNNVVKSKDLVIILGDFSFYKAPQTMEILKRLNGYKLLIEGNHDCIYLKNKLFDKTLYVGIAEYKEYHYHGYHLCLMHYPIQNFKHMDKETNPYIHVFGHIHSIPYLIPRHSYNAGADVNNYTPIHIDKVIEEALKNKEGRINGEG